MQLVKKGIYTEDSPVTYQNGLKSGRAGILVMIITALSLSILWMGVSTKENRQKDPNAPHAYIYGETFALNGMQLHYLRTRPSNLKLEIVNNNVTLTPYYGINGGFFYRRDLLSIAVVNDVPLNQADGQYGDGGANVKYARGTLVWDGKSDRLSVQVVHQASELMVSDRSHYWAQGGISMSLALTDRWKEQATSENAPFADEERLRSAAVYDFDGNLYLIVSGTKGSLASFREAIVERIGFGKLKDGIFLDGDGSSQLHCREAELQGDGRPVVQMMRLVR